MNILSLVNALPGAAAQGLIWGIMAIGVFITYKILDLADLTVDGTMCTGGAVCVVMMMNGHSVGFSLFCAFIAGMLAGLVTGIFHTTMGIPAILAGIKFAASSSFAEARPKSIYFSFLYPTIESRVLIASLLINMTCWFLCVTLKTLFFIKIRCLL